MRRAASNMSKFAVVHILWQSLIMTAQNAQNLIKNAVGLYVHVPFCAKKCEYCAFYKEKADRQKIDTYLSALEEELQNFPPQRPISTVFLGGGTPTVLTAEDLERLCTAILKAISKPPREWTIECAPATLKPAKLETLKKFGVNRFSLGVQSFSERTLEAIGRPHTRAQAQEAIELLKSQTANWNLDLIFAAADETLSGWLADLEQAIALQPPHLSTYCLTFESDTALFAKLLRSSRKKPSPEEEARFYLKTWEFLRQAGFHHYELANFAREGFECLHNLNTWRMGSWLGYGPSAATQLIKPSCIHRYTNIPDLEIWAAGVHKHSRAWVDDKTLMPAELATDALLFGLRCVDGVELPRELPREKLEELGEKLAAEGLLKITAQCWQLTDTGLLLADRIALEILERLERLEA